MESRFIVCPICKNKTRTKIIERTQAVNLPVFCSKCKNQFIATVKPGFKAKIE